MSRPLRIQYENAHYHVCARGNERRRIFWYERDYQKLCELLDEMRTRFDVRIYAFVLMTNHFHLMLSTPHANLSQAMHWLKTSYTVWVNRSHNRAGHLFQGRYHAVLVENESYYLELSRYIHLNPVRAKMVKNPEEYAWSSCRDYLSEQSKWPWVDRVPVLREIGGSDRQCYRRYREFLQGGMALDDAAWEKFRKGWVLGSDDFRAELQEKYGDAHDAEVRGSDELKATTRRSFAEALDAVTGAMKRHLAHRADHRGTTMYLLHRLGYPLKEIGEHFGVSYSAVSQNAKRYVVEPDDEKGVESIMSNVKR